MKTMRTTSRSSEIQAGEPVYAGRMLDALARLNQIGSAINSLTFGDLAAAQAVLSRIVEAAGDVVPGSLAVLFAYDETRGGFENRSRIPADGTSLDAPRPDGLGSRAVARRTRVLSYEEPEVVIHPAKAAEGAQVMACFPLIVNSEVLGALYIYLKEQRQFSQVELLMLENFANLTAMTLSMARQFALALQEQARKDHELRRLRRAGMVISSRSNLKETLNAILQVALEITDAIYGVFRLVDRGGKNLVCQAISGANLDAPGVETLAIDGTSVMGTVAVRREPIIISDLRAEPWRDIYYPLDHNLEMRSELAVPLVGASGRLEGVLNLESPQVNAFDRQDRYILQILATQAVVAIQEARLLDTLEEISALLPRMTPQMIHQTLVERACDLLNVPYGMVWLLEKEQMVLQAAVGPEIPEVKNLIGLRLSLTETLAGRAVLERHPLAVQVSSDEQQQAYADLAPLRSWGSALIVPLLSNSVGRPLGALAVYTGSNEQRDFDQSDWEKKVLDILGHYAALAVQLAQQQEALRVAQDQRALTEAFAAIGDIAANLLHRMNNKVGTIPVRVEGIQDKCRPALAADPYLEKNLAEIQRSAVEAMDVVRESLFHLHPIQLAPVSVAGSVREALASVHLPPGVRTVTHGLDALPPVQAGQQRLGLVFTNLIENALDAVGEKGRIVIQGSERDGWVDISVSDNGPGIPPALHDHIFEFNYSASRASAHPGKLGFGLWWVKSLVARFGGSIAVESDGRHGTTFLLSLPQAREDIWPTR